MPTNISKARREKKSESLHWWDRQHSLVLRQSPRWAQGFTLGITALGIGAITAGFVIKIDEVITAKGRLNPGLGSIEVKTPAGGLIQETWVRDGDIVKKGDLLMSFDTRRAKSRLNLYEQQIKELSISRKTTLTQYATQLNILKEKYRVEKIIYQDMKPLEKQGAASRNMLLMQSNSVLQAQAELDQMEASKISFLSDYRKRLKELETERDIAIVNQQYEVVRAPIGGIVFKQIARKDGVLNSGDAIMKIIPQKELSAQIRIPNKDIGFVKVGQKTNIRVDAFDYTRFGTLPGSVKSIGADAIEPDAEYPEYTFPVTLTLEKSSLEIKGMTIQMKSGYAISANLKLKEKRLITILSDLLSNQYDSLQTIRQ